MSESIDRKIAKEDLDNMSLSGLDKNEENRGGSFIQQDNELLISHSLFKGVEILSIEEALDKYPEVRELHGSAFGYLDKEFPKDTEGGYFIRVERGKRVELPIQACLYLKKKNFKQRVHNIIIIEEGASAHLITGCAASKATSEAEHLGVSEFYVKKNGYLNFSMIHSWHKDISVKPISAAIVEESGSFISNYVSLRPVKDISMYPTAILKGSGSRASFNSLILSHPGTIQDIGSRVVLKSSNTSAEITSRVVSLGGKVIVRGNLKAEAKDVKAHLECRGLIINECGIIRAVPEIETEFRDVEISHEAAIGKISREEIEYLCSRGFSHEEAQSIIVRGFMDIEILALPDILKREIRELEDKTLQGSL
ncbi:MAG: SufD family Fe-S cluster assembly protein [Candidatus Kaelpia imicola]|nr:SufD family Fe-S cluster assembly protein [Candidatus Kaelpia imicola]